jgi:hypothetical protein
MAAWWFHTFLLFPFVSTHIYYYYYYIILLYYTILYYIILYYTLYYIIYYIILYFGILYYVLDEILWKGVETTNQITTSVENVEVSEYGYGHSQPYPCGRAIASTSTSSVG